MPIIKVTVDEFGNYPCLGYEVFSTMVFPGDADERETARATYVLHSTAAKSKGRSVTVESEMLHKVVAGPGMEGLQKKINTIVLRAHVAGRIFLRLLEMRKTGEVPTVSACVDEMKTEMARVTTRGGSLRSFDSETGIRGAWRDYKPVAHLWAAMEIMDRKGAQEGLPNDIASSLIFGPAASLLLALSMDLLQRASAIPSADSNATGMLIDVSAAWVPPVDLLLPPVVRAPGVI